MAKKIDAKMDEEYFEQLEILNAQIDVWIDEEEFDKVKEKLEPSSKAEKILKKCFQNSSCTDKLNSKWFDALNWNDKKMPIQKADKILLSSKNFCARWSHFFWAKLLRAYIQQFGTDCYFRRLDETVAYLENHLPHINPQNLQTAKMAVIYLLEMSAASLRYEQIGFAERARRILQENYFKNEELFTKFYDLLARYNIGVAYFHDKRYRKAVREFNYIIYELKYTSKNSSFYSKRKCNPLLLWPSILYRADIQLKLQLAYHAFKTLCLMPDQTSKMSVSYLFDFCKRENEDYYTVPYPKTHIEGTKAISTLPSMSIITQPAICLRVGPVKELIRRLDRQDIFYKIVKSNLIKVEAYQQMGQLDESWGLLSKIYRDLFKNDLGDPKDHVIPNILFNEKWRNIKVRFLILLMENCLIRLEDKINNIDNNTDYLESFKKSNEYFYKYFQEIQYEEIKRNGYYEQLAKYLASLAMKASKSTQQKEDMICKVVGELYTENRSGLLEDEDDGGSEKCLYCSKKGINLKRLDPEHYDQFTRDMCIFYENFPFSADDGQEFFKRLTNLEKKDRENLEIRKLELSYYLDKIRGPIPSDHSLCFINSKKSNGFAGLLSCVNENTKDNNKLLDAQHYEGIMAHWNTLFLDHLRSQSFHKLQQDLHFFGLQRWNSSSPAMGRSVGGGYLLYHTSGHGTVDMGIAIDPGFDFVRNLFRMGFSLRDIDIILLSHAHLDHVRDFESIVLLLHELSDRDKSKKRLHVILTLGVYRRLQHIIEDYTMREYIEPYIIDIEKEIDCKYFTTLPSRELCFRYCRVKKDSIKEDKNKRSSMRYQIILPEEESSYADISIYPMLAYHNDFSGYSDSFGFQIEISMPQDKNIFFGYTGDTKWVSGIDRQYSNCDVLLVHLGSLIDCKKENNRKKFENYTLENNECDELIRNKNHPYLMGLLRLLHSIYLTSESDKRRRLILLSEFGEELRGGIRVDLIKRLQKTYGSWLDFLPVDVGLDVQLYKTPEKNAKDNNLSKKVWCVQCDEFVDLEEADFERYGHDEALFCVCKTCKKSTPQNVLWDRLRHLYEVGRELRPAPSWITDADL